MKGSKIHTSWGEALLYSLKQGDQENLALVYGTIKDDILIRIQSECVMGDVFGTNHCECKKELHTALDQISKRGGILFYLRQEGMGVGLQKKIQGYHLEEELGIDGYEAYEKLGFKDTREYGVVSGFLKDFGITSVYMNKSNNDKVRDLKSRGITVNVI